MDAVCPAVLAVLQMSRRTVDDFPLSDRTGTSFFRTDFAPLRCASQAVDLAQAVAVAVCAVALVLINTEVVRPEGCERTQS